MSTDLKVLAWTSALTILLWLPYIIARIQTSGLAATLSYAADADPLPAWAQRAKKAHYNAIENLAPFAALVLVAHAASAANAATAAAATAFFWARLAHFLAAVSGLPYLRTLTFAIGWLALLCIFYQIVT
jgi:uncharacterized MAPEG superfamily protein